MEGIKVGVIPWKMLTYSEKKKRRTRHSLLWFFKWVNSLNGVKLKRKCHSVNVFQQDLVLIVAVMNLKWVWTLRLNFNHMTECFILSCLRLFFLLGSPSITRKQDGRVHVFSLLWMLPKMFRKHPSSVKVTDDDTRVKTNGQCWASSCRTANEKCSSEPVWACGAPSRAWRAKLGGIWSKFSRRRRRRYDKLSGKHRLLSVSLSELFTVVYTSYFISSCCCFSCTLCVAELNDHMEHTERKKTLRIIMFQKVKPKRTTW